MAKAVVGYINWRKLKMKRRDFIAKGGIVGAGVVGVAALSGCEDKKEVAAPAIVADRVEIAMVSTWPRDFPGLGTGAQRFAQRLSDVTDGRIQVTYYAAGERVGAFDSFDEVASGNAQAYHAADYYWKGKHPGWAYFTAFTWHDNGRTGTHRQRPRWR